jgi:hypothetical protein
VPVTADVGSAEEEEAAEGAVAELADVSRSRAEPNWPLIVSAVSRDCGHSSNDVRPTREMKRIAAPASRPPLAPAPAT